MDPRRAQYALGTPAAEVRVLEGLARRNSRDVVVAPYGRLERGIALTAGGRLERLDHADPERVAVFVAALAGRDDHGWRR